MQRLQDGSSVVAHCFDIEWCINAFRQLDHLPKKKIHDELACSSTLVLRHISQSGCQRNGCTSFWLDLQTSCVFLNRMLHPIQATFVFLRAYSALSGCSVVCCARILAFRTTIVSRHALFLLVCPVSALLGGAQTAENCHQPRSSCVKYSTLALWAQASARVAEPLQTRWDNLIIWWSC